MAPKDVHGVQRVIGKYLTLPTIMFVFYGRLRKSYYILTIFRKLISSHNWGPKHNTTKSDRIAKTYEFCRSSCKYINHKTKMFLGKYNNSRYTFIHMMGDI
jgi:hypothetical protein